MIYTYALFNGVINLSLPLGVQAIIGFVISAEFSTSWGLLIFIVVAGVMAAGVIQILQLSLTELLQKRIFTRAAFEFAYRIPRFKVESIASSYAPELINRFFDTLTIQKGLSKILVDFSASSLQIFFWSVVVIILSSVFRLLWCCSGGVDVVNLCILRSKRIKDLFTRINLQVSSCSLAGGVGKKYGYLQTCWRL